MRTTEVASDRELIAGDRSALSKSLRHTLDLLFAHPVAHNLPWRDVIELFGKLGEVEHSANNETSIRIGSEHQVMRRPHAKDLTLDEVMLLRHFLTRVGWSKKQQPPSSEAMDVLVTIDHHEARIYHLELQADNSAEQVIRPYDPHHFLRHLSHKDQSREEGQRAAEDPGFYEEIARAVVSAVPHGGIVVVGHGKGHSDAGRHFIEWVRLHHPETAQRLTSEIVADLSAITEPQLLALGRNALRP